ncbi:hypothetical protein [Halalkalicoccus salilacus]|uniref:hypothetical protein n=1 Tax=Halalkalicoccus salilacus TaxID=3117459 RepID=UPI00300F10A9
MASEDEFQVGDVVTDAKGAAIPALIVEVLDKTAEEYVVSSSASGARITLADRYDHVPPTDPVYVLVFDPQLRRAYPDWQTDQHRAAIAAYRTGSFRSAARMRPKSLLTRINVDSETGL